MDSQLYLESFASATWGHEEKLEILTSSMHSIELRVTKFLSKISTDFPELTDHSIDHSLSLWKYADILVSRQHPRLNPVEAYLLHVTFLAHDAGICLSVLNGSSTIEQSPIYTDYLATFGSSDETKKAALFHTVRELHGDFARLVATSKLSDGDFLIQDENLREEFGDLIGRIAESHANNTSFIDNEITNEYVKPGFPKEWVVRCRRLAYILRVADAAHLDNVRTPKSGDLIRKLSSPSREHWTFQKKLGFPTISPDRFLVYSSHTPFTIEEQRAWWYCHDALLTLDREIRVANEYFEAKGFSLLNAKGVRDVNDPLSLGRETIKTAGWYSFDSRVRVTNPVHIAAELGGIKLYGQECFALRELVQNAIDAVNAYRLKTDQVQPEVGQIKVSLKKVDGAVYLVVTDNGIGMSSSVMTNELLDFGTSYWRTHRYRRENVGLPSSQFEAIGKYGIGFFSVFMLGDEVTVTSWRHEDAKTGMRTLEFYDGLESTPVLRDATAEEKRTVIDRGTSVSVRLRTDPHSDAGFIGKMNLSNNTLRAVVEFLVPSSDVGIAVADLDGSLFTIGPNNLEKQNLSGYLEYLAMVSPKNNNLPIETIAGLGLELIEVLDGDRLLGKLTLTPPVGRMLHTGMGLAISKGIRVCPVNAFLGFTKHDEIITVKRDTPSKVIPYEVLRSWGLKQKEMIEKLGLAILYADLYHSLLLGLKLYDETTPVLLFLSQGSLRTVSISELRVILSATKELKVYAASFNFGSLPKVDNELIMYGSGINFQELLLEGDANKARSPIQVVEDICGEMWGPAEAVFENFFDPQKVHALSFPNPHGAWTFRPKAK